jgi:Cytoskeletal-regulatory complex EF hand
MMARPAPPVQQQQIPPAARSQPPPAPPAGPASSVASLSGAGLQQQLQHQLQHQLAVQDPYSLTPQEQARYEQLFPDYAKDAQYMYGPEAVALFSKSGLPQTHLGQIWNLVDVPVDNRLDRLEFSMAMHLIVCVSKKNLPLPQALPLSMKQLKEYQRQQQQQNQQQQQPLTNDSAHHPPSTIEAPREVPQQHGVGLPPPPAPAAAPHQQQIKSSLPGPPPLPPQGGGGLSVSDAFEGLGPPGDTGSIASFSRTNQTAYESSQQQPSYSYQQHSIPHTVVETVEEDAPMSPIMEPAKKRVVDLSGPPMVSTMTRDLAKSYDLGESTIELEKLRSALQKLQAENISLKARLGSMTEEEKDLQKELGATISEIIKLSGELTTVRAQVLASKSRLLEASSELKTAKEKKGYEVPDLF